MKKPAAPSQAQAGLSPEEPRHFTGTGNPRHLRAINALLCGPTSRQQLDKIAGAANSPQLVAELRERGLQVPCKRAQMLDRDGRKCWPGWYELSQADKRAISRWQALTQAR